MDGTNGGGDHMHGMAAAPPPSAMNATTPGRMPRRHMMMHMTFYWGEDALILFKGWPGTHRPGMYALALVVVFSLAVLVEWFSHCRLIRSDTRSAAAGIIRTAMHALRIGLAYMVMLAVMSFNVGVFLAVVAGHAVGFLLFGSGVFWKTTSSSEGQPTQKKRPDLPPMSC